MVFQFYHLKVMEGLCNLGANRMMKWILKPESEYLENKHWREKKDKIKRGRGAQRALIPQDSPWAQCENHSAAAAAKSLQSCPTPCDPIDSSPPGSPVPGILQARTLEWVAISFSNAWKWKVTVKSLSRVWHRDFDSTPKTLQTQTHSKNNGL